MALQGTLDTFALPDVLRLLAATKKTGRLHLTGQRGAGSLWVDGGVLVGVQAASRPGAEEPVDALFELLRFEEGSFSFDPEDIAVPGGEASPALEVEGLLAAADVLLEEWRQIEAVVPSLDHVVQLRPTLDGTEVTVPAAHWPTLVAVAGGTTVRALGASLALDEIPVSRAVRHLVELGVAELHEPVPGPSPDQAPAEDRPPATGAGAPDDPDFDQVELDDAEDMASEGASASVAADEDGCSAVADLPASESPAEASDDDHEHQAATIEATEIDAADGLSSPDDHPDSADDPSPTHLPTARPIRARRAQRAAAPSSEPSEPERFVPLELPGHMSPASAAAESSEPGDDLDVDELAAAFPGLAHRAIAPEEDPELAEQLAALPPEAAEAVRAAAAATTDEERDAVLDAAVPDDGAPINRGVLLKFLSSIKS